MAILAAASMIPSGSARHHALHCCRDHTIEGTCGRHEISAKAVIVLFRGCPILFSERRLRGAVRYPQCISPCQPSHAMAGVAKSTCSHYVPGPMNDLFDKNRPRRNLDGGRSITIRGAREHNLKNVDVEIPRDRLVVFIGLSGSGKSSLAFDTIYAEGQRRYV